MPERHVLRRRRGLKLRLPLGLQEQAAYIPDGNPLTAQKVALGKQLFWDTRWSRNGTVACVSCHEPATGGPIRGVCRCASTAPRPPVPPTLVNRLFSDVQQWGGTRASLEDQAINASDQSPELLVKNLGAIAGYQEQFRAVFGTGVTPEGVAKAIAAYERMILSGNSPYDKFRAGNANALSASARRGLALFEGKASCVTCHAGFNFTDESYHNIGVGMDAPSPDLGRFTVTKPTSTAAPSRRRPCAMSPSAALHARRQRGPLAEVVAIYNRGGTRPQSRGSRARSPALA